MLKGLRIGKGRIQNLNLSLPDPKQGLSTSSHVTGDHRPLEGWGPLGSYPYFTEEEAASDLLKLCLFPYKMILLFFFFFSSAGV